MRAWTALVIAGLLYTAAVVWAAANLPDAGVPLHFGADGRADRFGSRAQALWAFGLLGAGLLALFAVMVLVARRVSPAVLNVPHKAYWIAPERQPRLRRMLAADAAGLGSATILLLAALVVLTTLAARADPARLPEAFPIVLGAYLTGVVAWAVWSRTRRYRPPARG
jgi:hypothetical protein